jgi:hypothetical protein
MKSKTGRLLPARAGNGRFGKYISGQSEMAPQMPLTHVTDVYEFREIAEAESLSPKRCDVFLKDVLYFFYGRPAYRKNIDAPSSSIIDYFPVCFVFGPSTIVPNSKYFALDTGAFAGGMMRKFFHSGMAKEDFELGSNTSSAQKLVKHFFDTNSHYFKNEARSGVAIPTLELEVQAYYRLIAAGAAEDFDDRVSAIEIQASGEVKFGDGLIAVILPSDLADEPSLVQLFEKYKAPLLPYDFVKRFKPQEHTSEIYRLVRDLYIARGFL